MNKIDLIIEAIRLAEFNVETKGWGDDIDLELYTEALAAARELRELKPVGWFDWDAKQEIWVQVYPNTHGQPLYALGDDK